MKRVLLILCILAMLTVPVLAMETPQDGPYPVSVESYLEGDVPCIEKVFRLDPADDPADIPTGDFELDGRSYFLLDMTRQEENSADAKLYTETFTFESDTNDVGKILQSMDLQRDVVTQDGYTGKLTLDTASIAVEADGYQSSSYTVSATRSYPSLSDADLSLVPKTIQENGCTLTLGDVKWTHDSTYYTANATYTGTASSQKATGYTVAANYIGQVTKTSCEAVIYTAIFSSVELPPEEIELPPPVQELEPEIPEDKAPSAGLLLGAIGCVVAAAALGMFGLYRVKERKRQ